MLFKTFEPNEVSDRSTKEYLERRKVIYLDQTPSVPPPGTKLPTHTNFLFRGNEPKVYNSSLGKDQFAYDLLKEYLISAAKEAGVTSFPSDFYIVDQKLFYFHDPFEEGDIILEKHFFHDNPSKGKFIGEEIWGDDSSPFWFSEAYRIEQAKKLSSWQHDDLPERIPRQRMMLFTNGTKPIVYYFHCECGCDRTGELAGAYAMKYLNMTFLQVMAWDDKIAERPILINHEFALEWYCYYLKVVEGFKMTCDPWQ